MHAKALAILLPAFLAASQGRCEDTVRLTREQARSDVRSFLRQLEATHPDPYTCRGGKVTFKRQAQQMLDELPAEGLSPEALADRLNTFLSPMRDGHSRVFAETSRFRDPAPWLPISFAQASDALYIQSSELPELKDCTGFKVLGVEGRPLDTLLDGLPLRAENTFGDRLRLSNLLRSQKLLAFALPQVATQPFVTYDLEDPQGHRTARRIPWRAVSAVRDSAKWSVQPPRWSGAPVGHGEFDAHILEQPSVGYLRVGSMMGRDALLYARGMKMNGVEAMMARSFQGLGKPMPKDPEEALQALPSLFETARQLLSDMRARQVQDLVIDLRGNTGGFTPIVFPLLYLMYGDAAYGHTYQVSFAQATSDLLLKKRSMTLEALRKEEGVPDLQLGDYLFTKEKRKAPEEARRAYLAGCRSKGYPWAAPLEQLDGRAFWKPRRVMVLCDPQTFSAGFHALVYLREFGAETVGVPSSQSPNAFMEMTEFELPESKLRGAFSNSLQAFLPDDPKATVFPLDHPLTYERAKAYGFDTEATLRYALDLLSRRAAGGR